MSARLIVLEYQYWYVVPSTSKPSDHPVQTGCTVVDVVVVAVMEVVGVGDVDVDVDVEVLEAVVATQVPHMVGHAALTICTFWDQLAKPSSPFVL